MMSRVQPLNLVDFTGGLNLRADAFQLAPNESPAMLNVEVDPRGGFHARRGWRSLNQIPISRTYAELASTSEEDLLSTSDEILLGGYLGAWNPRSMFFFEPSSGARKVLIANEGSLIVGQLSGLFELMVDGSSDAVTVGASPHGADFVQWLDNVYVAAGVGHRSLKWSGSTATLLTASGPGAWQNDYTAPVGGHMPKAELAATHVGYLFAANVVEGSTAHPNRLRWSHPNSPENWAESDYIDIVDGDGGITALVPMTDHLLVFKADSVWALYGYDADSWQVVNVTRNVGAIHAQAVVNAPTGVYFFSWPQGLFFYSRDGVFEVSGQLRPAFESGSFNSAATNNIWVGWSNRRVWLSVPFDEDVTAVDARAVFVFDPSIGQNGAWVRHSCTCGAGLGPFAEGMHAGGGEQSLACHRQGPWVMQLEVQGLSVDFYGASPSSFPSSYTTRWLDAEWPTLRKSWRRPDVVVKERSAPYSLRCTVFRDFDEVSSVRSYQLTVAGGAGGVLWTDAVDPVAPLWGSAVWGRSGAGSRIERGSNLGLARSVQVRFDGDPGKDWGVDAVVFKFIPRRLR
jgi:hypothetical protein